MRHRQALPGNPMGWRAMYYHLPTYFWLASSPGPAKYVMPDLGGKMRLARNAKLLFYRRLCVNTIFFIPP
jgi:hypothetical protein